MLEIVITPALIALGISAICLYLLWAPEHGKYDGVPGRMEDVALDIEQSTPTQTDQGHCLWAGNIHGLETAIYRKFNPTHSDKFASFFSSSNFITVQTQIEVPLSARLEPANPLRVGRRWLVEYVSSNYRAQFTGDLRKLLVVTDSRNRFEVEEAFSGWNNQQDVRKLMQFDHVILRSAPGDILGNFYHHGRNMDEVRDRTLLLVDLAERFEDGSTKSITA